MCSRRFPDSGKRRTLGGKRSARHVSTLAWGAVAPRSLRRPVTKLVEIFALEEGSQTDIHFLRSFPPAFLPVDGAHSVRYHGSELSKFFAGLEELPSGSYDVLDDYYPSSRN